VFLLLYEIESTSKFEFVGKDDLITIVMVHNHLTIEEKIIKEITLPEK
jgi:hypothetical protein